MVRKDNKVKDAIHSSAENVKQKENCLPPVESWPNRPLLICHTDPSAQELKKVVDVNNDYHEFENKNFKGRLYTRLRDLSGVEKYFDGKKRLSSMVIIGQFKRPLRGNQVYSGQEFSSRIIVPRLLIKPAMGFFRFFSPMIKYSFPENGGFSALSPLIQLAQVVGIHSSDLDFKKHHETVEDTSLSGINAVTGMNNKQRKQYFSKKTNVEEFNFSPDKYYAFDFYNDVIDLESYNVKIMGKPFDVSKYTKGQPIRIMAKIIQNEANSSTQEEAYLWNFEIWHEKLLSSN